MRQDLEKSASIMPEHDENVFSFGYDFNSFLVTPIPLLQSILKTDYYITTKSIPV